MHNRIRRIIGLFAVFFILISCIAPAQALTEKGRLVRVAYPLQKGLTDYDEYGNYCGYTYEYLEEIAQYTGWDYEFVEGTDDINETLTQQMEMLKNGEIDLMGGIYYTEELGRQYDYSSQSYGVAETILQVLVDDAKNNVINSQIQQTFRIAIAGKATRSRQELEDYCSMNMVTPVYVQCDSSEEQLRAMREGRADMMLNTSMNPIEGVKTIARFASKPFYFATSKGNDSGLMHELNMAIISIEQADPYFSTTLFNKYFSPKNNTLMLTDGEQSYIQEAGTLKVGILTDQPPFQYLDATSGLPRGISIGVLNYIAEKTGLSFEYVKADSLEQLYEMASSDQVNLVAGIPYDYEFARDHHLSMSRPYISSQYYMLMNESANETEIQGKRLALSQSVTYDGYFVGQVVPFPSVADCIRAVSTGQADYTYVDSYTVQYYINFPEYRNLKIIPQTYEPRNVCLGLVKPGKKELLSIVNKCITTLPETDLQSIINQNTIQKQPFTLRSFLQANPVEAVSILVFVFLGIIFILSLFLRQRYITSKKNALELKKHFQVYALVKEYFFEYNFKTQKLIISIPSKDSEGQTELNEYNYAAAKQTKEEEEQKQAFLDVILSQKSGIKEVYFPCQDGQYHWLQFVLNTVYDGNTPAYTLGRINIIDEEKQEKDILLKKSQLDSLTQIYNAEMCREAISKSLEHLPEGEHGALLIIDIDNFKSINDTYGHLCGDETLIQMAALLKQNFRKDDIVGRPGGDEFIVYMKNMRYPPPLTTKCEILCRKANDITVGNSANITISIGAALSVSGQSYEALYKAADEALYHAKEAGRNQFQIHKLPEE